MLKFFFLITLLIPTNWAFSQNWTVLMSKSSHYGEQIWKQTNSLSISEIKHFEAQGFFITNISYGAGEWGIVFSKNTGFTEQKLVFTDFFPKKEIEANWEIGFQIIEIFFLEDQWFSLFAKNTSYSSQIWIKAGKFPKNKITKHWSNGYKITQIAFGDNEWVIIMSKNSRLGGQSWNTSKIYPEQYFVDSWYKNKCITGIVYGKNRWLSVMSQFGNTQNMVWRSSKEFPAGIMNRYKALGYKAIYLSRKNPIHDSVYYKYPLRTVHVPTYKKQIGCTELMQEKFFARFFHKLESKSYYQKVIEVNRALGKHCFSLAQIALLMQQLRFPKERYYFARKAYQSIYDQGDYLELKRFIKSDSYEQLFQKFAEQKLMLKK